MTHHPTPPRVTRWCERCDVGTDTSHCWSCDQLLPLDSRRPSFTPHPYRPPVEHQADPPTF